MDVPYSFWITLPLITVVLIVVALLLYYYLYLPHCDKKNRSPKLKYWMLVIAIIVGSISTGVGVGVGVPLSNYLYEQKYLYDTEIYVSNNIKDFFKIFTYNNLAKTLNADDNIIYANELHIDFEMSQYDPYIISGFGGSLIFNRQGKTIETYLLWQNDTR